MQSHYSNDIRAQTHWKRAMAITIGYIRATERCVQPNDGLYPKRERLNEQYTTPLTHRIRTCNPYLSQIQHIEQLQVIYAELLSPAYCSQILFVEFDSDFKWFRWMRFEKKNGQCDGAKMLDWQIMICFSLEMWWYFIDSTSLQKLKKYALAPNSTNRLTIKSDEFFKFFFEYCTYGYYNDGENFIFMDFIFVKMCWNS